MATKLLWERCHAYQWFHIVIVDDFWGHFRIQVQWNGISSMLRLLFFLIDHCRDRFVRDESELISIVLCRARNAYRINNRTSLNTNSLNPWSAENSSIDSLTRSDVKVEEKETILFIHFPSLCASSSEVANRFALSAIESISSPTWLPATVGIVVARDRDKFFSSFMSLDKTADNNRLLYSI